jgi:hypothetical protein
MQQSVIDTPVTLITFDAHNDHVTPGCIDQLRRTRESYLTVEILGDLCNQKLSKNDDDWIIAGMELGLIGDAVTLGVSTRVGEAGINKEHTDHLDAVHQIATATHPGDEFEHQGRLSDIFRRDMCHRLWDILDWKHVPRGRFDFLETARPIWLDIDLDAFVMRWEDFTFPWPDEVWRVRYCTPSQCSTTQGWTGQAFFEELLRRAVLLTIATEPSCCGGQEKAQMVLSSLNQFLFAGKLISSGLGPLSKL